MMCGGEEKILWAKRRKAWKMIQKENQIFAALPPTKTNSATFEDAARFVTLTFLEGRQNRVCLCRGHFADSLDTDLRKSGAVIFCHTMRELQDAGAQQWNNELFHRPAVCVRPPPSARQPCGFRVGGRRRGRLGGGGPRLAVSQDSLFSGISQGCT